MVAVVGDLHGYRIPNGGCFFRTLFIADRLFSEGASLVMVVETGAVRSLFGSRWNW